MLKILLLGASGLLIVGAIGSSIGSDPRQTMLLTSAAGVMLVWLLYLTGRS